jgi:uncharacterized protein YggE
MKPIAAVLAAACLAAAAATPTGAQTVPPAAGISVQGHGVVRRPADVARFTVIVGDRQNPAAGLGGADALVAALKRAGVADAAVSNPIGNVVSAQAFATVTGSVRVPTPASVRALVAAVESDVSASAVVIQNVNFALGLDDCSAAQAIADQAALDDARARAQRLASAAHVELGAVVAITELSTPAGPCPTKPDRVWPVSGQFDPLQGGTSLEVVISANANVTFAIK